MRNLIIATLFLIVVALGCSSGPKDAGCTGKVTFNGKDHVGKANTVEEAKRNACNMYCRDSDEEYEARYRIWLYSPKGKSAGSPSKQEAIFKDKDLMEFVTVTCADKCLREKNPSGTCPN